MLGIFTEKSAYTLLNKAVDHFLCKIVTADKSKNVLASTKYDTGAAAPKTLIPINCMRIERTILANPAKANKQEIAFIIPPPNKQICLILTKSQGLRLSCSLRIPLWRQTIKKPIRIS